MVVHVVSPLHVYKCELASMRLVYQNYCGFSTSVSDILINTNGLLTLVPVVQSIILENVSL